MPAPSIAATTTNGSKPTGTVAGSLLICSQTEGTAIPSGFTLLASASGQFVSWRLADGNEGSQLRTLVGNELCAMARVVDHHPSDPIVDFDSSVSTQTCPSVDAESADSLLVRGINAQDFEDSANPTAPASHTIRVSTQSGGNRSLGIADRTVDAGATGTAVWADAAIADAALAWSLVIGGMSDPPTVTGPSAGTVREGIAVTANQVADITASNDPTSYAATGLPSGVTLDTETGEFGGEPAAGASAASPYTVTLTATNAAGESDEFALTLIVLDDVAPVIQDLEETTFELQLSTDYEPIDDEAAPVWSSEDLPEGLTLTEAGLLSGPVGDYEFTVTLTAEMGQVATRLVTISATSTESAQGVTQGRVSLSLGLGIAL